MLEKLIPKSKVYLQRNASTILTGIGIMGVITTVIVSAKDTVKATQIWKEVKDDFTDSKEKPTKLDYFKASWKCYIPTTMVCLSTISCILGANILNKRNQASLISAYTLLDNSYKEYRNKVKTLYGEDADSKVQQSVINDNRDVNELMDGKKLFFESNSCQYFESTLEEVQDAEYLLNRTFALSGEVTLGYLLELLGIPDYKLGSSLGWSLDVGVVFYGYSWIDFDHEIITLEDGLECCVIRTPFSPTPHF